MELYYSFSILIILAAIFSYINVRFLKFPSTIGIMIIALIMSIILVLLGSLTSKPLNDIASLIKEFDFTEILMGCMLNFLLFAGAIHINMSDLKEQRLPVIIFSTLGVIISAIVVGVGLYYTSNYLLPIINVHTEIPLIYCLLFGALISPTDPIAVLSILKQANVSKSLETKIAGESLLNDGVAVVLFAVLANLAYNPVVVATGRMDLSFAHIFDLFLREAVGGLLLGAALGYLAAYAIRTSHDYKVSVLITLAVVMGGYLIASSLHTSAPLAMVGAGLIIGESRRRLGTSKKSSVGTFWELIDEVMNAILFLFMGFQLLLIDDLIHYWLLGIICIIIVLFARFISIKIPTMIIPFKEKFSKGTIAVLVWGGLRGGVSIALALSVPESDYKETIIAVTYVVVVFSILVQGLTVGKVAKDIQ
ncbi:sodium:proton antiporter [Apibacter sp. ESL0404]|uniref:cation:proton antiporter n=1 Tax=Apibacter sp. ESL0404 TaxID=2704651 RepID=UPI001C6983F3|nr:sodium:proton antiporter [Apibacter sp. ESL0404]QYN50414.1 sodium:proton antiporter [Apibacter sp. ESL0404]